MTISQSPTRSLQSSRRRVRRDRRRQTRRGIANSTVRRRARVVSTNSLGSQQETNDDRLVHSSRQSPRLVRVRVSADNGITSTAVSTQDAMSTDPGATPVHFGGPMATLTSEISMVLSRDLLYFDQRIPLVNMFFAALLSEPLSPPVPSPITRVALNLTRIPGHLLPPLWMSVDSPSLSLIFLVCEGENLRPLAENAPSNEWGFRPIPEREAVAREPQLYELILKAFSMFAVAAESDELECRLVFDWEGRGRD